MTQLFKFVDKCSNVLFSDLHMMNKMPIPLVVKEQATKREDYMKPIMPLTGLFFTRDIHLLEVMTKVLDRLCIKTVVCMSAETAMKAAKAQQFDCAFIDWMSNKDSLDVVHAIRSNTANKKTCVMAVMDDHGDLGGAFKASVNLRINKPMNNEQALRFIRPAYTFMLRQRRESYRLSVNMLATMINQKGQSHEVRICDISDSGACLQISSPVHANEVVKLAFNIPHIGYGKVTVVSEIVWRNPKDGTVGVKFAQMPSLQKDTLKNWVAEELRNLMNSHAANNMLDHQVLAA